MTEQVRLVPPAQIERNPENPRLIFRQGELDELESSIKRQGILVPLTVFETQAGQLVILDGERRWRCARKLGLRRVPVIVQPEPTKIQNIMMMFAIHNARKEWEPLPTAFKLRELEQLFTELEGRAPKEAELAQVASLTRGEVRRLKKLLTLPADEVDELMREAEKPQSLQIIRVDQVLEATKAAEALRKRKIVSLEEETALRGALIEKFKTKKIKNTVEPRKLAKLARAVERQEVTPATARREVRRLISDHEYTVAAAFERSVGRIDYEHTLEKQIANLAEKLRADLDEGNSLGPSVTTLLVDLARLIQRVVR